MAKAGNMCPPVPPAIIKIVLVCLGMVFLVLISRSIFHVYSQNNGKRDNSKYHTTAAITDKGQGVAFNRH